MSEENESVVSFGISLYPDDVAKLHQIGKDYGLTGRSATIRFLIRDWSRLQSQIAAFERHGFGVLPLATMMPSGDDDGQQEELVPA